MINLYLYHQIFLQIHYTVFHNNHRYNHKNYYLKNIYLLYNYQNSSFHNYLLFCSFLSYIINLGFFYFFATKHLNLIIIQTQINKSFHFSEYYLKIHLIYQKYLFYLNFYSFLVFFYYQVLFCKLKNIHSFSIN